MPAVVARVLVVISEAMSKLSRQRVSRGKSKSRKWGLGPGLGLGLGGWRNRPQPSRKRRSSLVQWVLALHPPLYHRLPRWSQEQGEGGGRGRGRGGGRGGGGRGGGRGGGEGASGVPQAGINGEAGVDALTGMPPPSSQSKLKRRRSSGGSGKKRGDDSASGASKPRKPKLKRQRSAEPVKKSSLEGSDDNDSWGEESVDEDGRGEKGARASAYATRDRTGRVKYVEQPSEDEGERLGGGVRLGLRVGVGVECVGMGLGWS